MAPSDEDVDAEEFDDFTIDDILIDDDTPKPEGDLNASLDVVLIEKSNEIVVIEDDHKDEKVENNEEIIDITAGNTNIIKDTDTEITNKSNVPQIPEVQQDIIETENFTGEVKQFIENKVEENNSKLGDKNQEGDENQGDANQEGDGLNEDKNETEIEATVVKDIDDSVLDSVDALAEDDLEDF